MGLVMWAVDATSRKTRDIENLKTPDALFIGTAQALALFPGVSRSGSTITAGLFTGLTREAAARFSFLMMTPIMLAATGYKFLGLLRGKEHMTGGEWGSMILATVVAGITGYIVIGFLLGWLRRRSLMFFVAWRLAVGALCIGMFVMQGSSKSAPSSASPASGAVRHHVRAPVNRGAIPQKLG
jgi:undecaprenyl-diphosphatase